MELLFYIVVTLLSAVALYVGVVSLSRPPSKTPRPESPVKQETTRWRRYLVHPGHLKSARAGRCVLTDETTDRRLLFVDRLSPGSSWLLVDRDKTPLLKIERASLRRVLRLTVETQRWLELSLAGHEGFPSLTPTQPVPKHLPRAGELEIHGDHRGREFEIRRAARLVASVSWQKDEANADDAHDGYYVEVVKSAEPLPILGLVVSLEIAAQLEGMPAVIEPSL